LKLNKPVIFLGIGRCGTTIISEIIFQHPDLAWPSIYQNKFPGTPWINRLRPLLDNRFWSLQGQKQQIDKIPFYKNYVFRPSEANDFWQHITGPSIDFTFNFLLKDRASSFDKQRIRNFFERLVRYQKRKRLSFKITGPSRIGYLKSIFPDAVFIEITREPFANIRSLLKVPYWINKGSHQLFWEGAYTADEQKLALKWRNKPALLTALQYAKVREKTLEEVQLHKAEFYSFAYENFIKDPKKIITQILSVTGLESSTLTDNYLKSLKIHERNVNAYDFFDKEEQPILNEILRNIMGVSQY